MRRFQGAGYHHRGPVASRCPAVCHTGCRESSSNSTGGCIVVARGERHTRVKLMTTYRFATLLGRRSRGCTSPLKEAATGGN